MSTKCAVRVSVTVRVSLGRFVSSNRLAALSVAISCAHGQQQVTGNDRAHARACARSTTHYTHLSTVRAHSQQHQPKDKGNLDRGIQGPMQAETKRSVWEVIDDATVTMCSFSAEKVHKVITQIMKIICTLAMACTSQCISLSSRCGRQQPANQGMCTRCSSPRLRQRPRF